MKLLSTINVFFFTPTRVLGQMSAVHREWTEIKWARLHTDRQHSRLHIYTECKYWQHMARWKNTSAWKTAVFSAHTHYLGNLKGKPVMKKVCASALRESLHMWGERWCISTQTAEPDTRRTWGGITRARAGARQGLILTIIQNVSATTEPATIWETNREAMSRSKGLRHSSGLQVSFF